MPQIYIGRLLMIQNKLGNWTLVNHIKGRLAHTSILDENVVFWEYINFTLNQNKAFLFNIEGLNACPNEP